MGQVEGRLCHPAREEGKHQLFDLRVKDLLGKQQVDGDDDAHHHIQQTAGKAYNAAEEVGQHLGQKGVAAGGKALQCHRRVGDVHTQHRQNVHQHLIGAVLGNQVV